MHFQVVNKSGLAVMGCSERSCIPELSLLKVMADDGYKFKIDGKVMPVKKIKETLDGLEG